MAHNDDYRHLMGVHNFRNPWNFNALINWQKNCLRSAKFGGDSIRSLAIVLLISIVTFFPKAPFADSRNKTGHLFRIERSINRNFVQFDVRLMENSNLPDSSPVIAYWVLENGEQEELTLIQQKYAYGIHSQEQLEKNRFRIFLVALRDREIIIEKIGGSYRAVTSVKGKKSILEKAYVKSKEGWTGFPQVSHIDLFGRARETGLPVEERIIANQ
jgi:hypothetical protein